MNYQHKDRLFELSFLDNVYTNPLLTPTKNAVDEIRHSIDLLSREKSRSDSSVAICQSLLHVLLGQIERCIESQQGPVWSSGMWCCTKSSKPCSMNIFPKTGPWRTMRAARLNLTQHHLNVVCKQVTGTTAGAVIRLRGMLEAKRLLTFTDLTVAEIGLRLGFEDSSYFARFFKRETGLLPQSFQQAMSEKYPR